MSTDQSLPFPCYLVPLLAIMPSFNSTFVLVMTEILDIAHLSILHTRIKLVFKYNFFSSGATAQLEPRPPQC